MNAYSNFSDLELIVSLKQGDERALKQVFDLHFSKLYIFCYRFLKNRERAEEIVHDALLNV